MNGNSSVSMEQASQVTFKYAIVTQNY